MASSTTDDSTRHPSVSAPDEEDLTIARDIPEALASWRAAERVAAVARRGRLAAQLAATAAAEAAEAANTTADAARRALEAATMAEASAGRTAQAARLVASATSVDIEDADAESALAEAAEVLAKQRYGDSVRRHGSGA